MKMGSMDRTLTAKSLNFRQICQWTAATSLVATGAVALFSANTLDKLSQNGNVRLDLEGFQKVGSITLALDRVSEERAILEEERLLSKASFAAAEALPAPKVAFRTITLKKKAISRKTVVAKLRAPIAVASADPSATLSAQEAADIAFLERAVDPEVEAAALAQVYRRMRSHFVAAAETIDAKPGVDSESTLVAGEAYEYDELPEYDEADFALPAEPSKRVLASEELDAEYNGVPVVETAPAVLYDSKVVEDTITSVASAPTMAPKEPAAPMIDEMPSGSAPVVDSHPLEVKSAPAPAVIASPGLDLMPEESVTGLDIQDESPKTSQVSRSQLPTGPPQAETTSKIIIPPAETEKTVSHQEVAPATVAPSTSTGEIISSEVTAEALAPAATNQNDLGEYSADIHSVYVGDDEESETEIEYSPKTNTHTASTESALAESIIEGEFDERQAQPNRQSNASIKTQQSAAVASVPQNMGNGISRDAGGITIDWNENSGSGWKANETESGGKIFVGKPNSDFGGNRPTLAQNAPNPLSPNLSVSGMRDLQKKFSFTTTGAGNAATIAADKATAPVEPQVENKTCDTVRLGVEALQPGAEKETLAICRRVLSHEGEAALDQARWWENHNSENGSEHWPTLSYQKPSELGAKDRVPLLSTASIRILSAISRANTHSGMGIVFGRVAQGLEIQLAGRSEAPIYLDAGMKVRDPKAVSTISRQFVILNVEPGQPLLLVKDPVTGVSGSIPLVVKAGMATHLDVSAPHVVGLDLTIFDSSAATETRMANLTAEVIGQPGKLAITNAKGTLWLEKIAVFGEFPIYVDLTQSEKSYKNRFRIGSDVLLSAKPAQSLYFFGEKRVAAWLSQLSGGVSPHSGLVVGLLPSVFTENRAGKKSEARHLKLGILDKKSTLVPERYHLDRQDGLVSQSKFQPGYERYIGVQIPEGPCVPTVIDEKGKALWSTLVYAQPGVINVVTP